MSSAPPKVFLSFAYEDKPLAAQIAHALQASGIDTWWAEWCIGPGDSIRQKIDEGLRNCTHFVVLLTPASLPKPWVNAEIDAGFLSKLGKGIRFISLRAGLPFDKLTLLLQGQLSPEIDPATPDLAQLINDIHGITRKPPLGSAPVAVRTGHATVAGYSKAATAVARLLVERSAHATRSGPHVSSDELIAGLALSKDDVKDALNELGSLVMVSPGGDLVIARDELFVIFDQYSKPWNPADDALHLATKLVNDKGLSREPKELAKALGWEPRRFNPAAAYLFGRGYIKAIKSSSGGEWLLAAIHDTDDTRRFVKAHS